MNQYSVLTGSKGKESKYKNSQGNDKMTYLHTLYEGRMALIDEDAALALPCRGNNNNDKDNREKVLTECGGKK